MQPGSSLLTLVPMGDAIYLIANFKETQVGRMVEGPGKRASRSMRSATTSSMAASIPSRPAPARNSRCCSRRNATGNFTKIVQRVPVKIALEPGDPLIVRLRPGLSAEAVVDVRGEAVAKPAGCATSERAGEKASASPSPARGRRWPPRSGVG